MEKTTRLNLLRSRASQTLNLSPVAAATLEQLRREDPDLGGVAAIGEILPADDVRRENAPLVTDDEEIRQTELISPLMRAAVGFGVADAAELVDA